MIHKMSTFPRMLIWLLVATEISSEERGSVRLVGGPNIYSGRVEVFLNEEWGTVCDDHWGIRDGHVVCRQLGYSGVSSAKRDASYGAGTGPIHMSLVGCDGSESRLEDCSYSAIAFCEHDAGVACNQRPTDCGFSDDGSSGNILFDAAVKGTCSVTIESTIDELIIISVHSYAFEIDMEGNCVNDVEEYGDNQEIDNYCGLQNSPEDSIVHANRYEIVIRTRRVNLPSRFEASFRKVDSSISCNFDGFNECDIKIERTSWTRGTTTAISCDWYDDVVTGQSFRDDLRCGGSFIAPNGDVAKCNPSGDYPCCSRYNWCGNTAGHCNCDSCIDFRGAFLQTNVPGATFELPVMPSCDVALSFGYASSDCWRSVNDVPLIVGFCGISLQVSSGGYFLKHLSCADPFDTITFIAETTSGSFVYVDDIRVWYLVETGNTDSSVPTTSSNDGESSITDAGGAPTSKNSAKSGNNAMLNDRASSLVVYVIPAVLVVLVLLAAIIGIVIFRRRRESRTTTADASVSYNNRTYDTGSPIQTSVPGDQLKNGIIAAADKEEVHNPAYQSSGDAKDDLYNVAYESSDGPQQLRDAKEEAYTPAYQSSGDNRGEVYNVAYESSLGSEQRNEAGTVEYEHDYAVPGPGPGTASEYQYVDYKK